jgi:hypothetical protein
MELKWMIDTAVPSHNPHAKKPSESAQRVLTSALAKCLAWSQLVYDHFGVDRIDLFRGGGPSGLGGLKAGDLIDPSKVGGGKGARSLTGFSSSPYVGNKFGSYPGKGMTYARIPPAHAVVTPFHFLTLSGTSASLHSDQEWEAEWFVGGVQDLPWKYSHGGGKLGQYDFDKMKIAKLIRLASRFPELKKSLRDLIGVSK